MKILITEPEYFDSDAACILKSAGKVTAKRLTGAELESAIKNFDVVVVRVETHLDRRVLSRAKRLKIIGSATTGLNHIDTAYARRAGIKVISLHGTHTVPTAEHTFALMLSLARKIPWAFESLERGSWHRYRFIGEQLQGKTLGVIGLGRIGMQVARYARAFGMTVVYFDPYVDFRGFRRVSLNNLLASSDIVTIHAMLTNETRRMIGYRELKRMKKSALLINTARGEIADDNSLIRALKGGIIAGAALDVFPDEPVPDARYPIIAYARRSRNLIVTPHIAASTKEAVHEAGLEIARKVAREIRKGA